VLELVCKNLSKGVEAVPPEFQILHNDFEKLQPGKCPGYNEPKDDEVT